MTDEKTKRIKKAVGHIHEKAQVKDATQLRGRVRILTSSTILKIINDIVEGHSGESDNELLTKITEAEFELLKVRKNSEILRADLEQAREDGLTKDATIKELTEQLGETLGMAERRESEVRQLSEMIKKRDNEHAAQVKQLRGSLEEVKSARADTPDPEEMSALREELTALQSELRMSEDIEEMQRSEIADLEENLEADRSNHETQIGALSRKIDQFERELRKSRELEKKLRAKLTQLAKPEKLVKTEEKPTENYAKTAIQLGYCTAEQIREAHRIQKSISEMGLAPPKLGEVLVDKNFITEGQATEILRAQSSGRPKIEGYELVSRLGEGLLGATYKARQLSLDREVAVKIIRREFGADKEYADRFLDQAKQAGRLHHKNIAHVIDAGEVNGVYYCISEYVRGQNLREILHKKKMLAERQVLHIGLEAAYAFVEAHRSGLVHSNIKPSNIIVNVEGVVKVCDFGLARRINLETEFSLPYGLYETAYYTSPEVVQGGNVDIRSDIYSLGATLFSLTTGNYPFGKAATPREALLAHLNNNLPDPRAKNPDMSQDVAQIITRMLEPQPENRYQNPKDLIAAFISLIKQKKAGAPTQHAPRRRHTRRKHR